MFIRNGKATGSVHHAKLAAATKPKAKQAPKPAPQPAKAAAAPAKEEPAADKEG